MNFAFIPPALVRLVSPGQTWRTGVTLNPCRQALSARRPRARMMMTAAESTKGPSMVRARHILVDSEAMVDAVKSQLDAGEVPFSEMATKISTCTSKERGGDLGWFQRSVMVREFEEAAFDNPPGSIVKVKTEFGWHLILVEEHGVAASAITVDQFEKRFGKNGSDELANVQLIDVREGEELEKASLPGFTNLPMGDYGTWGEDFHSGKMGLDKDKETIVMCHHGVRSANFCSFLAQQGYTNVRNLIGGIDSYSRKIDSSVPTY